MFIKVQCNQVVKTSAPSNATDERGGSSIRSFTCPFARRVGPLWFNGKWICNPHRIDELARSNTSSHNGCLVYSFREGIAFFCSKQRCVQKCLNFVRFMCLAAHQHRNLHRKMFTTMCSKLVPNRLQFQSRH